MFGNLHLVDETFATQKYKKDSRNVKGQTMRSASQLNKEPSQERLNLLTPVLSDTRYKAALNKRARITD